jgi:hypothetical protein
VIKNGADESQWGTELFPLKTLIRVSLLSVHICNGKDSRVIRKVGTYLLTYLPTYLGDTSAQRFPKNPNYPPLQFMMEWINVSLFTIYYARYVGNVIL